ncbi:MAG: CHAT domain-containing protein [Myxococcales bacterium]|nr:CHAT domain-containing protein [Myxococcales bacterium]
MIARRLLPLLTLLAYLLAPRAADAAPSLDEPFGFYISAFFPELGDLSLPSAPDERRLFDVAAAARDGRASEARTALDALSAAPNPRVRAMALVFSQQLARLRLEFPGGGTSVRGEVGLENNDRLARAMLSPIPFGTLLPGQQAAIEQFAALAYFSEMASFCGQVRRFQRGNQLWLLQHGAPFPNAVTLDRCQNGLDSLVARNPTIPVLLAARHLLVARAGGGIPELDASSRNALDQLLSTTAWSQAPCVRPLVSMLRGDLVGLPLGDAETLGYDPWLEFSVRDLVRANAPPNPFTHGPTDVSLREARARYDDATRMLADSPACDRVLGPHLALRRAHLSRVEGRPEAEVLRAYDAAVAAAAHASRLAQLALGSRAILAGDGDALRRSIDSLTARGDRGGTLALVEAATGLSLRRLVRDNDLARALPILDALTTSLPSTGLVQSALDVRRVQSDAQMALGRTDLAIATFRETIALQRASLRRLDELARTTSSQTALVMIATAGHDLALLYRDQFRLMLALATAENIRLWLDTVEDNLPQISVDLGGHNMGELAGEIERQISHQHLRARIALALLESPNCSARQQALRQLGASAGLDEPPSSLSIGAPTLQAWLDVESAQCDPGERRSLVQRYASADPTAGLREALGRASQRPSQMQNNVVMAQMDAFVQHVELALRAGAFGSVLRWLDAVDASLVGSPVAAWSHAMMRLERARALIGAGRASEAVQPLRSLVIGTRTSNAADDTLRQRALFALVEATFLSGDQRRAFEARELLAAETRAARFMRGGTRSTGEADFELAALERRIALGESLSTADLARRVGLRRSADASNEPTERPSPDSLRRSLETLPANTTVLTWFVGERGLYAWILGPGSSMRGVRVSTDLLGTRGEVAGFLRDVAAAVDGWRSSSARLAARLRPVLGAIDRRATTVVISPPPPTSSAGWTNVDALLARDLSEVPFEVLLPRGRPGAPGVPTVVYVAGLTDAASDAAPDARRGALVMGANGATLRSAESEAGSVAAALRTRALVGVEATRDAWLQAADRAACIHIAAHGELTPVNPLRSQILLGGDTRLEGWQIARHVHGADLVVFSSCNSSQVSPLGATTSLASVAHDGGARWVIASRWDARDDVFSRVMAALYPALATGADVRMALDAARRSVAAQDPSTAPYLAAVTLSVRSLADLSRAPLRCVARAP